MAPADRAAATVIVDYDAGNLRSVEMALAHLGVEFLTTSDPDRVHTAQRVIFPGVGGAGAAMAVLRQRGLDQALLSVAAAGRPMLGICVGCQIIFDASEEAAAGGAGGADVDCLGLLGGRVTRMAAGAGLKIPHMGWNVVRFGRQHPLVEGIDDGTRFYFVHSYSVEPEDPQIVVGATRYGRSFPAVVARDTLVATQFHAEKSGRWGLRLLDNFLRWSP